MSINKKLLGEAELIKKPQKKLNLTIKDGAITSGKIKDKAITARKLGDNVLTDIILPLINQVRDSLQSQIDALEVSGIALSDGLGGGTTIGITQKGITDAINEVWTEIDKLRQGEQYKYNFSVSPKSFIHSSIAGQTIQISASTRANTDIFSEITFTVIVDGMTGSRTHTEENVSNATYSTNIMKSATVICDAVIDGVLYRKVERVEEKNFFWIGSAGYSSSSYSSIVNSESTAHTIEDRMGGNYDITFTEDSYLYVIQRQGHVEFQRADMNGIEIEMESFDDNLFATTDGIGIDVTVFRSLNTFKAGTYNIDINA